MSVLSIENISKSYGTLRALDGLSLTVQPGEVYGILGPNGSGKTTTLGILLGVLNADAGSFQWFQQSNSAAVRRRIGAILETPNFYPNLNAIQNLQIVAHIKQVNNPDIPGLLKLAGLWERAHSPFRSFSLGMKQRLAIAGALVGDPEVLIFDEPTNGLDPQGIAEVRELLGGIAARGKTVLLASHIIDEVEKICSHVAILKKGKLIAAGRVQELLSSEPLVEIAASDHEKLRTALGQCAFVSNVQEHNQKFILGLAAGNTPSDLNKFLFERGLFLNHLVSKQKSLEAEFLERTK